MRLTPKRLLLGVILLLVAIQFHRPDRTNPPVDPAKTIQASIPVDPGVQAVLDRSCADCHTNRTVWPWYSNIAPVSWVIADDVRGGRRHLNLSEWATYSTHKQADVLEGVCRETTRGDMPESQYTMVHTGAVLQDSDVKTLCDWSKAALRSLDGGN